MNIKGKNAGKYESTVVAGNNNKSGLPDALKAGIENLSGIAMDDVKVDYNSAKPAQLNTRAYAQGDDIHVAADQKKHLSQEAWHVEQQQQGHVHDTLQNAGKIVNDDRKLEKEADAMGAKAAKIKAPQYKRD